MSVRIGVIGTNWGLMHVGAFRAVGAEVVALCGANEAKTRALAHREGIPLATSDVQRLVDSCDAVIVSGPDRLHREHVELARDGGLGVTIHVGEEGGDFGLEEIGEVVESLRPDRLGHGILAARDPSLMTAIREADVRIANSDGSRRTSAWRCN